MNKGLSCIACSLAPLPKTNISFSLCAFHRRLYEVVAAIACAPLPLGSKRAMSTVLLQEALASSSLLVEEIYRLMKGLSAVDTMMHRQGRTKYLTLNLEYLIRSQLPPLIRRIGQTWNKSKLENSLGQHAQSRQDRSEIGLVVGCLATINAELIRIDSRKQLILQFHGRGI
tara:strand:+ start:288 stop:800 length:513 start_codon:yes stop_codon:yes gene_type:complete